MKRSTLAVIAVATVGLAAVAVAGVAIAAQASQAPEPAKAVDSARLFTGRWYEIGRTPMKITDGCVAGTTDYLKDDQGRLTQRDACRQHDPAGKEKVIAGPITILNPGANNKYHVSYKIFQIFTIPHTYWILDHGDDYDWFIASDPSFKNVNLFTRASNPDPGAVKQLTARIQALGYDTSRLEFPALFPPGQGRP